jgi:predicted site-specific integrase-resolvase
MKKVIRLTESDLSRIIKRVIKENEEEKVIKTITKMVTTLNPEVKNELKLFSNFNDNQKVMFFDYMMANINEGK